MTFAAILLIIFSSEMLIFTNFIVFGMAPMCHLISAIALFTLVIIIKHSVFFKENKWFYNLLIISVSCIFLNEFMEVIGYQLNIVLKEFSQSFIWNFFTNELFHGIPSLLLLLPAFALRIPRKSLRFWCRFTAMAMAVSGLVQIYYEFYVIPVVIYQYYGVVNLPMLFGWLMIIHCLIIEKLEPSNEHGKTYILH